MSLGVKGVFKIGFYINRIYSNIGVKTSIKIKSVFFLK
jgi:hypothetical protein